ncbi:TWiK family of potassium channels protein 18 isoform X2 [Halyomorpha halys]|uniref:TWiK family of potassium channels protein 18 isoform X2 n=1 Tax=Halyomorpha halys TaxID=286706 RepID=UPI0034D251FB
MQRKRSTRRSFKRQKTWGQRLKDYLRNFVAFMFSNVGIIGLVIGYTIAGSFMFIAIESPKYTSRIGYGNVAPRTEWGKLATILYAIAGMPLFLLYLSNIGDILAKSFKWTYAKCCLCTGCQLSRPSKEIKVEGATESVTFEDGSDESSIYDPQSVTVPITLCLAIMVGYVYGGAILFGKWEKWGLLDGAYFCFISLSTIGFGDIVPGDMIRKDEGIELRFIFCSMYLMLGMALIAMCFNLMQEEVVHKIRTCGDMMRRITRCNR